MTFEWLCDNNLDRYIGYLKKALLEEPDMMWIDEVDEEALKKRIQMPFFQNTKSLLAIDNNNVVGRIEYHFYGCFQDGFRMAYVDWVYVLRDYRHQGIAQKLFKEFEKDCAENHIDQYYLIRAENKDADKFYHSFENAVLDHEPILRKNISNRE